MPTDRVPPYLTVPEPNGPMRTIPLPAEMEIATIGRRDDNRVVIAWDPNVSRVHAELRRLAGEWTVADDGLSRNGTSVNGHPLLGRRRLRDGDVIEVGLTKITFRTTHESDGSTVSRTWQPPPSLTEAERRVLDLLCRPCLDPRIVAASPASNREIAAELYCSVATVKTHLHSLYGKFEIGDLPRDAKRARLVADAIARGVARHSVLMADSRHQRNASGTI